MVFVFGPIKASIYLSIMIVFGYYYTVNNCDIGMLVHCFKILRYSWLHNSLSTSATAVDHTLDSP